MLIATKLTYTTIIIRLGIHILNLFNTAGSNALPSITPNMGSTSERKRFELFRGAPNNENIVVRLIAPIIQANGK